MDLPKAPDTDDMKAVSGIWNYIVFFIGLIFSGGAIEYWISSRYVTKKELQVYQANCKNNLQQEFEIALLKNNARLEEKMISAVSSSIKEELRDLKNDLRDLKDDHV